ncbi:hypothetical protein Tco_0027052 [Tanacetum coccineum]
MDEGTKNYSFDHIFAGSSPSVLIDKTKSTRDGLKTAHTDSGTNEELRADDISKKIKLEDLSEFLKDTRSAFFTPDSPQDDPIIVTDESEEEEADKEDTHDNSDAIVIMGWVVYSDAVVKSSDAVLVFVVTTSRCIGDAVSSHYREILEQFPPPPSLKSAQIQELMAKVELLKSQKDELEQQKATAKAEVASLKARTSYPDVNQLTTLLVTSQNPELSKLLASHNFASFLPTDLKDLPLKFTELSGEIKELKQHVKDMEIELPGDLKEIPTKLDIFTSTISSLTSSKIAQDFGFPSKLNKVIETLNREDGSEEVISNHKVSDLHLAEWREVIQAYPDKSEKGWKTIYDLVKTRLDQLTQTEKELKIDLNKPLKEQDPPNKLNELANKKRKRTSDLKDHSRSTKNTSHQVQHKEEVQ